MEYTKIPGTELTVSRLAFGGWTIAGGNRWGDIDDSESEKAVRTAVDGGMTFIDTAEAYGSGRSEEVIGRAIEGIRDTAIIATKVHYIDGHYAHDKLIKACEESLRRLRTDYIDLYQLHWPVFTDERQEAVAEALETLKKDGKIRYYGVCNFGVEQLGEFLPHATPVTNQLPYGILWRSIEDGITGASAAAGMGILAYSSLHSGVLSGRYHSADDIPESRVGMNLFTSTKRKELTMDLIRVLDGAARDCGVTVPVLSLGWVLRQKGVTSILVGARSVAQVEENLAFDPSAVPPTIWEELTAASTALKADLGGRADMFQDPSRIR